MAGIKISGTDKIDDLTFYTLFNVLQAGMWLQNDIEKFLKPYGLSHGRFSIMLAISENSDSRMVHSEISLFMGRSRPTVSKMLKSLEDDGLVESATNENDGRSKNFRLTGSGAALLEKIIPEYNKRLTKIGANLTKPDKVELMDLLSKLNYPEHGRKIKVKHA